MKEIQKKDLPEVSGGFDVAVPIETSILGPGCIPLPPYPPTPGGPIDAPDSLTERIQRNQVQS